MKTFAILLFLLTITHAETKIVRVFVALCDNKTQGIVPVGAKIGDGNLPSANLYWGCSDGLAIYFPKHKKWTVEKNEKDESGKVMRTLTLKHHTDKIQLIAEAYRGSEMKACFEAYEKALASGNNDLVAFIGHNALMDFHTTDPEQKEQHGTAAIVLACKSRIYFQERIKKLGGDPILLTDQFMYPGSFILHDAIEAWYKGQSKSQIRDAAGKSYAKNQKISVQAATGVFSIIK